MDLKLMLIHKSYKYRIYPTKKQEAHLLAWQNTLRFLWNLANEQRILGLSKSTKKYYSAFEQQKELTELRKENDWVRDVPGCVSSELFLVLEKSWKNCFKRISKKPKFKKKNVSNVSFCFSSSRRWRIENNKIYLQKLGLVPIILDRLPKGSPKTCAVTKDVDQWFVTLVYAQEINPEPRNGPMVAIDRGITNLLVDSNGKFTENPRFYEKTMKKLAKAQRSLSRKQKGSQNRIKAKTKVAKIHRKIRRQRNHVMHTLSSQYAKSHGIVVMENLNVQGMVKSRLSRHILDAGWSSFKEKLKYKLEWSGGELIEVFPQYSSQTCSKCNAVDKLSRSGEKFNCTTCGHKDHADLNAAKIILTRGESALKNNRTNRSVQPVEGSLDCQPLRSRKEKLVSQSQFE